ncbi:hypothetical protein GJ744_002609 [Endocarpon pusillum]|uniref:Uncharacterized protein n=1 Tax=Endocarpon pusillum TaxID=364733 RepID=A0A8H7E0C1_9EURO|nr:hypothetical protein GJ744_002609 [Endocarpon pusillum]
MSTWDAAAKSGQRIDCLQFEVAGFALSEPAIEGGLEETRGSTKKVLVDSEELPCLSRASPDGDNIKPML